MGLLKFLSSPAAKSGVKAVQQKDGKKKTKFGGIFKKFLNPFSATATAFSPFETVKKIFH